MRENCSRRESFKDLCAVLAAACLVLTLCFFPARSLMAGFPAFNALFTNLQFPWRLLGVVSFLCAMLGGAALFGSDPGRAEEGRASVSLGIALAVLAIAMVPRYDTANGDYYAFASYDAEYTEGHYMKLIGIPKAKHTIVYPYEWMPEGAGEAEALGASEVTYLPDDAGIVDTSYVRDGLVSQFEYVIGEDTELTGERWAVLPLFAYGGYEALDEAGRKIPPEYEDSTEAVNGSEAGGSAEYDTHPAMARSAGGLLQVPLSNAPGVHSYTVAYQAPAFVAAGGWASIIGLLCFAAVSVILNRINTLIIFRKS